MNPTPKPFTDHGFVLLEALVAMALIAGLGVAAFEAYQGLILRYGKVQAQMKQLRQEFDQHEIHMLAKRGVSEPTRMSHRNGALPATRRPITKSKH